MARCVLGNGTHVGRGASLDACLVLGSDTLLDGRAWSDAVARGDPVPGVGDRSVLRGVVLDRNAAVGVDCELTNRAGVVEATRDAFVVVDSIIVVGRNAFVPPGTVF